MKEIINALQNSIKNIKNIPASPIFDATNLKNEFSKMGLPEKFIQSAIEESKRKHEQIHGDNTQKIARIIISEIVPILGGMESFSTLIRAMKNEDIENNKVKFTNKELSDYNNTDAQKFISKVKSLYDNGNGKQISEIVKELNFYSYQTLNGFIKDNREMFK